MTNLFYLTILGSIFTIFLIVFKNFFIKKYGGVWYYYIWILVLICYCFPFKIDIGEWFHSTKFQQEYVNFSSDITLTDNITIDIDKNNTQTIIPNNYKNNNTSKQNNVNHFFYYQFFTKKLLYCIYIIGFFITLLYYSYHYIKFQKFLKNTTKNVTNEQYLKCFNTVRSEMEITDKVTLKQSNLLISPIFIGIIKPTVILPNINFDITDLHMILKHELMHYKRNDMIYRFFALIVHMIHWFNPIAYIALCSINEACEYSCDEIVTKNMDTENKIQYGNMLLNQIQYCSKKYLFFAGLLENNKNKNILKRRLNIIMNNKKYSRISISLLFVFAVILCSNFFNFYKINANINNQNEINTENDKTNIYQNFAKTLTQHQLEHIYKFNKEINDKILNYISIETREFTSSEKERYSLLRNDYITNGIRPKNSLAMEAGIQEFYIDFNNRIYHYPTREMTDEELLQLIEWDIAQEYANSIKYNENSYSQPNIEDITETEAINTAKQYIENLFDADTTNLQVYANFYKNSDIQPDGWFIRLYPEGDMPYELNWNYAVWINTTEKTIEVARSSQTYPYQIITEEDKNLIFNEQENWFHQAKSILEQKQYQTDIQSISFVNMDSTDKKNTVDVKITANNGSFYIVSLYYPDKELKSICIYSK